MGLSHAALKASLRGLVGFGVTPFYRDFTIDQESLRRNAAHLAKRCDVVVALGNNGEIFSLSFNEQILVGRYVVEEIGGRKPVLVGVGFRFPIPANSQGKLKSMAPTASWCCRLIIRNRMMRACLPTIRPLPQPQIWASFFFKHPNVISACLCFGVSQRFPISLPSKMNTAT